MFAQLMLVILYNCTSTAYVSLKIFIRNLCETQEIHFSMLVVQKIAFSR